MIKLSELNTDSGLDLICDLTEEFEAIAQDDLFKKIFEDISLSKNFTKEEATQKYIKKYTELIINNIPKLLKKYKKNIFKILSLLEEKTVKEIKEQNLSVTIKEIKEIFQDKDIRDFFMSFRP